MSLGSRFIPVFFSLTLSVSALFAQSKLPPELQDIQIIEKLGQKIETSSIIFRDEENKNVALSSFFDGKRPVIINMLYFECPNLCNFVLNGMLEGMRRLNLDLGKDYQILTVSVEPKEDAKIAAPKKKAYLAEYGRLGGEAGWHFLTGEEAQIKRLAQDIGFNYRWDEATKQYAHSAGIFVLTGDGHISRVLHGIEFPAKNLKLALLEASRGQIGTVIDRVLLFCYSYDPNARGYSVAALRLVQAGGAFFLVVMMGFFFVMFRQERKRSALVGAGQNVEDKGSYKDREGS